MMDALGCTDWRKCVAKHLDALVVRVAHEDHRVVRTESARPPELTRANARVAPIQEWRAVGCE